MCERGEKWSELRGTKLESERNTIGRGRPQGPVCGNPRVCVCV